MKSKKIRRRKDLIKKKNILHNNIPLKVSAGNGYHNVTITQMRQVDLYK